MEKFKIFAWSSLSYFVTFGFMSCFERSFTFQDIGETLIQILFSFYFNGIKYTLLGMYVNMYVCMCIHVDSFSLIKQHILQRQRIFLKIFVPSPVYFGPRRSQAVIQRYFQEDR